MHLCQHKPDVHLVDLQTMVPVKDHFVAPMPLLLFWGCEGGVMVGVVRIRELRSGVMQPPASSLV